MLKEVITQVGPKKVSLMVTDNASNCKKARQLLVAWEGFMHIMVIR